MVGPAGSTTSLTRSNGPRRASSGADDPRSTSRPVRDRLVVAAVLAVVVVAAVLPLVTTGSTLVETVLYLGVWVVVIWLPGVLLWRLTAGTSLLEIELGAGAVCGIALLLVSWLVATALGVGWLIAALPVLVLVVAAVHPRWRQAYLPRRSVGRTTPLGWWLAMGVLGVVAIRYVTVFMLRPATLPPGPSEIAPDGWYVLGIAQQLLRGFPVADPSLAGTPITYHWFSLAVITATSQLAHTDLTATVMHLWFVPFMLVWLCVSAGLTRLLLLPYGETRPTSRRWWWGPIAAALIVVVPVAVQFNLVPYGIRIDSAPGLTNGLNSASTSGAFGGLFVSGIAIAAITFLRDPSRRSVLVPLLLLIVAGAGIKPTVLLVVGAAAGVAGLWWWVTRRRLPWAAAVVALAAAVALGLASRVVVGSSTGVLLQPFSLVGSERAYATLFVPGAAPGAGSGGFWLPALAENRPGAVALVASVVAVFLLAQTVRLVGVVTLAGSVFRGDVAGWWAGGTVVSGFAAAFAIGHSGFSQQWFALNVTGVGIAFSIATLATLRRPPSARTVLVALLIGLAAAAAVIGVRASSPDPDGLVTTVGRLIPYGVLALVAAIVGLVVRLRSGPGGGPAAAAVAVAVVIGAAVPTNAVWLTQSRVAITGGPAATVTRDQQLAALWLRAHSGADDVVISNVFCRPVAYQPNCNHAAVWVGALTGRSIVLDGWAYLPQTMAPYDGTVNGMQMPSPFPDRLRDSLAVVRDGNRAAACRLVGRYGADWVYADGGATSVSPRLTRFATLSRQEGDVGVYRLDPARLDC